MIFNIKKNATLPILKVKPYTNSDKELEKFNCALQNANITFTLYDLDCVKPVFKCRTAKLEKVEQDICVDCPIIDEYYITYTFTQKDTKNKGIYKGEFTINFNDGSGTLIAPIQNDLIISII